MGTLNKRVDLDAWGVAGARWYATRSPCVRRQVGAVLIKNGRVVGGGFNGPSKGLPHRTETPGPLQCIRIGMPSGSEPHTVCCDHAESNACQFTDRADAEGATCFCTDSPCRVCAGLLVNAGVVRVVAASLYPDADGRFLLLSAGVSFEIFRTP